VCVNLLQDLFVAQHLSNL